MGISAELKQISTPTLELLKQDAYLVGSFFDARWLAESPFWRNSKWRDESVKQTQQQARERFGKLSLSQTIQRNLKRIFKQNKVVDYDWKALETQFLQEWKVPELDLHKYYYELTFLLAGYIPSYYSTGSILPELKAYNNRSNKNFLPFLVIENSEWDSRPLVNAIGAGVELGYETGYGSVRYIIPNEIEQVLDGLLRLTEEGFKERYRQASQKSSLAYWMDWSDEEMFEWLTDYYNDMVNYYQDAATNGRAMLLYLT
jgi:Domain of unknown function (DUF1877)